MAKKGTKFDVGKPRYDLIPSYALEGLAEVYKLGANKYGDRNWEKGIEWNRVFRALISHAWKWWRGENNDADDGQHHLLSVAWNAIALYEYQRRKLGKDCRPKNG